MILLAQGKTSRNCQKHWDVAPAPFLASWKRHALRKLQCNERTNSYLKHRQNSKAQRKLGAAWNISIWCRKVSWQKTGRLKQISARLKVEKSELSISYSTIYHWYLFKGWFWYRANAKPVATAPQRQNTAYKKSSWKRGKIQISNHLNDPSHFSAKSQSLWTLLEADAVLGKAGGALFADADERNAKSRFELVENSCQKAEAVQKAMIKLLDSHILRSITPDRGKEFAQTSFW